MPNLEILRTVSSFKVGDVVSDDDVKLLGATPEDWINVGAAKRTDAERSDNLDVFHVPGTREHAAKLDADAVAAHDANEKRAAAAKANTARNLAAKNAATATDGKPGASIPPTSPAKPPVK